MTAHDESRTRPTSWRSLLAAVLAFALAVPLAGLAAGALFTVSAGAALADDDDDDDDDDDRPRWRSGARRAPPRAVAPRPRPARARPAPEYVALLAAGENVAFEAAGFAVLARESLPSIGGEVVRLRSTRRETGATALRRLRALLPGRAAGRNLVYRPSRLGCTVADCPSFEMVGWPMPPSHCTVQTTIGMLDTAVEAGHPAFAPGAIERLSLRAEDRRPSSDRHGTSIAALLVGRSDSAHPGLLPRSRVLAVDVFHQGPDGRDATDVFALVRGIDALIARDIRIANLSLTGPDSPVLRRAVEAALERGMLLVAAAGNAGSRGQPLYPAAYDGVIAVTAVDRDGRLFRRANRGRHIAFAAPGVDLMVADTRGRARPQSGTSLAAPFVTAALAVALRAGDERSASEAVEALRIAAADLGAPGRDREFGWGLIRRPGECDR